MKKYIIIAIIAILSSTAFAQLTSTKPMIWDPNLGKFGEFSGAIQPGIGYTDGSDLIGNFEPRFYFGSWKMRNNFRPGRIINFYPSLVLYPLKFEGTLEYRDGVSYLRTKDKFITLLLPKKQGLVLDTKEGQGPKTQVWGYFLASPLYQLVVEHMSVNGVSTSERTLLTPFDRFPLF